MVCGPVEIVLPRCCGVWCDTEHHAHQLRALTQFCAVPRSVRRRRAARWRSNNAWCGGVRRARARVCGVAPPPPPPRSRRRVRVAPGVWRRQPAVCGVWQCGDLPARREDARRGDRGGVHGVRAAPRARRDRAGPLSTDVRGDMCPRRGGSRSAAAVTMEAEAQSPQGGGGPGGVRRRRRRRRRSSWPSSSSSSSSASPPPPSSSSRDLLLPGCARAKLAAYKHVSPSGVRGRVGRGTMRSLEVSRAGWVAHFLTPPPRNGRIKAAVAARPARRRRCRRAGRQRAGAARHLNRGGSRD